MNCAEKGKAIGATPIGNVIPGEEVVPGRVWGLSKDLSSAITFVTDDERLDGLKYATDFKRAFLSESFFFLIGCVTVVAMQVSVRAVAMNIAQKDLLHSAANTWISDDTSKKAGSSFAICVVAHSCLVAAEI